MKSQQDFKWLDKNLEGIKKALERSNEIEINKTKIMALDVEAKVNANGIDILNEIAETMSYRNYINVEGCCLDEETEAAIELLQNKNILPKDFKKRLI